MPYIIVTFDGLKNNDADTKDALRSRTTTAAMNIGVEVTAERRSKTFELTQTVRETILAT